MQRPTALFFSFTRMLVASADGARTLTLELLA